jgi:sortase A
VDATQSVTSTPTGYPATPKTGDIFGTLTIPRLKRSFPLVQGTGDEELKRGVGHMVRTVMPGEIGNCVISGHRDTVFTGLGKVEKGDRLIVETAAGEFTYEVSRIRIVDKEDRTVVVPTEGPVLTVSAPDRYVLVADLVANP